MSGSSCWFPVVVFHFKTAWRQNAEFYFHTMFNLFLFWSSSFMTFCGFMTFHGFVLWHFTLIKVTFSLYSCRLNGAKKESTSERISSHTTTLGNRALLRQQRDIKQIGIHTYFVKSRTNRASLFEGRCHIAIVHLTNQHVSRTLAWNTQNPPCKKNNEAFCMFHFISYL